MLLPRPPAGVDEAGVADMAQHYPCRKRSKQDPSHLVGGFIAELDGLEEDSSHMQIKGGTQAQQCQEQQQ